jgi:hypothetical protein
MIVCKECKSIRVQHREWVEINTGEPYGHCDEGEGDKEFYFCPDCDEHCELIEIPEPIKFRLYSPDGFDMHNGKTYDTEAEAWADFEIWKENYRSQGHYTYRFEHIPIDELREYMILKEA